MLNRFSILSGITACLLSFTCFSQDILPTPPAWKGKSLELIVKKDHAWITPAEKNDFTRTPTYDETMAWLKKLCNATNTMKMISIGKSAQYRDINMVIASTESFDEASLRRSSKPLILIQAGIHPGEIDGKDAGMMLLRDIAFGSKKKLLDKVNILFIPILSVDGHERSSPYNRVNQRGPENMGWRNNSKNLNLNRDYTKLDTEEIKAVVQVMTKYEPDMYLDLHVTDGADYQYDITYGFSDAYSPAITHWLKETFTPATDKHLKSYGHIPGPLIFAANQMDFSDGIIEYQFTPRYSTPYGDVRHIPSILVENHSLKPFKQRVLGTYVFLEAVIHAAGNERNSLMQAIDQDKRKLSSDVVLTWKRNSTNDTINFLGFEVAREKSAITNAEYVVWKSKPITQRVPVIRHTTPDKRTNRPRAFWIPGAYTDVINRLRAHGILLEVLTAAEEVEVSMFKMSSFNFGKAPTEGRFMVNVTASKERRKEIFYPGSVRIDLEQPLSDLIVLLLHPESPDSFLQWGFFNEIFSRTEYIEGYAIEPLIKKMLTENPQLKEEFEKAKQDDPALTTEKYRIYEWFYSKSPYFDQRYLVYPVGVEE